MGSRGIELLLVRTRGGRWTFPKGGTEPGLSYAQAAALEAFEEAGVHGRIEEVSFAHYTWRKRGKSQESAETKLTVHAHLCQVLRLEVPQECNRNPTWFSPEKAKQRLREDRVRDDGAEVARVVDRAVARIQRLSNGNGAHTDALQKVQFEPSQEGLQVEQASYRRIHRQDGGNGQFAAMALALDAYLCNVLRLPADRFTRNARLPSAAKHRGENQPNSLPIHGANLPATPIRTAMRLPQVCDGDGGAGDGPVPLQIIRSDRNPGTQASGKRRGSNS
jgi:8-oxo-dGTP pyrophosphatase MutT (NUDIX family)